MEEKFSDDEWIDHICNGSSETRFQYCKKFCDDLLFIRAIQGHTGGKMMAPELMGHVAFHVNCQEFIFH